MFDILLQEATTSGGARRHQKLLRDRPAQKRKLAIKRKMSKGCPAGSKYSLKKRNCVRVEPSDSINRIRNALFRRKQF